jgi:Fic family protein
MLSPHLRAELDARKERLDGLRPWPQAALRGLEEELTLDWLASSLALQGPDLSPSEVGEALGEGAAADGAPPEVRANAANHRRAIDYTRTLVQRRMPFSAQSIRQLHFLLLKGLDDAEAGRYRRSPLLGQDFVPARPSQIRAQVQDLLLWLRGEGRLLHPVERAALAHYRLIRIQPFGQANEVVARLLMNFLLLRQGYPPAAIPKAHLRMYGEAIQRAHEGERGTLVRLVGEAVRRNMDLYLQKLARGDRRL